MIRPAQLKLLDRAREAVALNPDAFGEVLRRCGGVDRVEALTAIGFERLMDHLTVKGFRSRQRPMLSAATRKLIEEARHKLSLSDYVYTSDLRAYGCVADERDLDGQGLIALLGHWEKRGLLVASFVTARRQITPKQLRLVQLARNRVAIEDGRYYRVLQDFGGVLTASDLDQRGLSLVLAFLEAEGFDREPLAPANPGFGRRPGFASPEQVELIRALWREWKAPSADRAEAIEAGLNVWLERYHGTSSLRFLTTLKAGKVITALKAMKARHSNKLHDERERDHIAN